MDYKTPYLSNTTAPPQALGMAPLLNPYCAQMSAQRGVMLADHLPQAQHIRGAELPHVYSGFEWQVGQYEFNTTTRDQDIQVLEVIDRYVPNVGMYPIPYNSSPFYTVIYLGAEDGKVGYFNVERYTQCTDGYGYKNVIHDENEKYLTAGTFVPKELKISSSPAWKGTKYCLGTNLNTLYVSDPRCTEDAFIISESAAKKLSPLALGKLSLNISPDQILLNMAKPGELPKFFPGIGEKVREDGILLGVRKPTADSIIHDTYDTNIDNIHPLHDLAYYAPPGATVVNVEVIINRKCKIKSNTINTEMYQQLYDYRDHTTNYHMAVWEAYQRHVVAFGGSRQVTQGMNTLVTRAACNLFIDNKRITGFNKKADISIYKNKDPIPFIHLVVTYAHQRKVTKGFKVTGLWGNKGTVSEVIPDEMMYVDEHGHRADIVVNPVTTISRMNLGQLYQHTVGRTSIRNIERMRTMGDAKAWDYLMGYLRRCNPNYADVVERMSPTAASRKERLDTIFKTGTILIQMSPFQEDINTKFLKDLATDYPVEKTPATYYVRDRHKNWRRKVTKAKVTIAPEYWMLLHKMPDDRGVASSYVNSYSSPMKAGMVAKITSPVVNNPTRTGEDETRKLILISGPDAAARTIGTYANSIPAKTLLCKTLLTSPDPAKLTSIPMETDEMVKSNTMLGVTRHIFSTIGIEISPPKVETGEVDGY